MNISNLLEKKTPHLGKKTPPTPTTVQALDSRFCALFKQPLSEVQLPVLQVHIPVTPRRCCGPIPSCTASELRSVASEDNPGKGVSSSAR